MGEGDIKLGMILHDSSHDGLQCQAREREREERASERARERARESAARESVRASERARERTSERVVSEKDRQRHVLAFLLTLVFVIF